MAPVSFSPDNSISSHTLSAGSAQPSPMDLNTSNPAAKLLTSPLAFLQPTTQMNGAFLAATKQFLDPVAAGVSEEQSQRQQEVRKKRKRGEGYDGDISVLHLKKVHLQGFDVNQVFEQARKILDAATEEIELALPQDEDEADTLAIRAGEDDEDSEGSGAELEEGEESSDLGEEGVDWEYDGEDVSGEGLEVEDDEDDEALDHEDVDMENDEGGMFSDARSDLDEPAATYQEDKHGLNDPFFDIDMFNKQTDFLEQRDNQGEAADTDEDEINWEADPYFANASKNEAAGDNEDMPDEGSDEEGGPTFGNVDLNAPEGESDDEELQDGEMDGMEEGANANNIMYADFFAPPASKVGRNKKKRGRPNPHNFPSADDPQNNKPDEEDIQNVISRVHGDLFSDEDDVGSDHDLSDVDPSDPKSRRSTHERRQAKLAEQIRKLEAANVAKRGWQLSGEARASDRPVNSLLEEDLEYERAGKPVPVITQEVSEDIEALIKRRILAGEFDEVPRRRPDDLATGPRERRGLFELDDAKNTKGLAEIYEEEHLKAVDPNFVDARDEKLKKEHAEISELWKSISAKLDSLASSNFKPKPVAANLEIRVDAPAIQMEDARPTAGGDVASASMLAPQELYRPGEDKEDKTEIVTKGGLPFAREEMTREQKLRRRRREKERIKKAGLHEPEKKDSEKSGREEKSKERKQLLGDLKKGGVQVIGKKGVVTDVEGKEVKEGPKRGAGSYKL
ncbi:U3 snoRNP protein [Didymosphaeria variabile]|uniref:U3 small nucleolar ribonucleoprotein protein MPP10 n=1 Tax=Didymosphaeria variabile TaxID=1932322 RepID=A0A9W9CER6_9PLEO|nr:U3 snoRNP protein [Didymosphaeria variabile]KAJ4357983.1 U3 snoRNP protein [Didymosphaeria variabile]